jgi:hypothetical protein
LISCSSDGSPKRVELDVVVAEDAGVGGGLASREVPDSENEFGDHPADRVAMESGEVSVEDDDVVLVQVEFGRGDEAVVGDIDGHGLVPESLGDVVGETSHVFDNENSHPAAPVLDGAVARGSSTITVKPPAGPAWRSSVPRCAVAIAATIARPSLEFEAELELDGNRHHRAA